MEFMTAAAKALERGWGVGDYVEIPWGLHMAEAKVVDVYEGIGFTHVYVPSVGTLLTVLTERVSNTPISERLARRSNRHETGGTTESLGEGRSRYHAC